MAAQRLAHGVRATLFHEGWQWPKAIAAVSRSTQPPLRRHVNVNVVGGGGHGFHGSNRGFSTGREQGRVVDGVREYFYFLDAHGRLHLDDVESHISGEVGMGKRKVFTIATAYKDEPFLDFFFRRVRPNTSKAHIDQYPFVSPCGKELNFLRPEDTALVFSRLQSGRLYYSPTLYVPFQPDKLSVSDLGRMYHPAPSRLAGEGGVGLVGGVVNEILQGGMRWEEGTGGLSLAYEGREYSVGARS